MNEKHVGFHSSTPSSSFIVSRLCRQLLRQPFAPAADQSRGVFITETFEFERRTGAGCFGRSSAISDDELVFWQLFGALRNLIFSHQNRALDVALPVCVGASNIYKQCLALLRQFSRLGNRDATRAFVWGM